MVVNLWFFLSIAVSFGIGLSIIAIVSGHKRNMKKLEVEALKVKQTNIRDEVEDALLRSNKELLTRIEILEAIVTDKSYELNEKITKLK